mgnify:CR=1 FL=1
MRISIKITTNDSEFTKVMNIESALNEVNLMTEIVNTVKEKETKKSNQD